MIKETVRVLQLSLHQVTVGYLAGYQGGRNLLTFDPGFIERARRPTFTLSTHVDFPNVARSLRKPWSTQHRLPPVLANLLPEGALRELLAQTLKVHVDNEFPLLAHLGGDLPGALIVEAVSPDRVPDYALQHRAHVESVLVREIDVGPRFSLAGAQVKFSMRARDGRYHISRPGELGDWIVKVPSTRHPFVPQNEFSAMTLARSAGVEIPDIRLVPMSQLDSLPPINLPQEPLAFAIRRFDREGARRIHSEDFAQVFHQYPHEKYDRFHYGQIAATLLRFTGHNLANLQQFARRLLVNILLANGDAHLKNWSLIYPDTVTPELAPGYDIVSTRAYIENEQQFALDLGRTKSWYRVTYEHFEAWARRAELPWSAIRPHLHDALDRARTVWPRELQDLPMYAAHKDALRAHWRLLQPDFRID